MGRRAALPIELTGGPFNIHEARRAGLTAKQLRGASWRRIGGHFYVWTGLEQSPRLVLESVARRLPTAVFSGRTAAWLHGLDFPPCDPVEVTISPEPGTSIRNGISIRRSRLADCDVVDRHGLRATSALRTVIDLGRTLPLVEAVVALDAALHRGLVAERDLRQFVAPRPRLRGSARLARALVLAEPRSESPMETRLRLLLVLSGLPRPEVQAPLHDRRGRFIGRPDLLYREPGLALEYDGGTHRDSLVQDNRRQNLLLGAGFRILRFTAGDVLGAPGAVVNQVRALLKLG